MKDKEVLAQTLRGFGLKQIALIIVVCLLGYFVYLYQKSQGVINDTSLALSANQFAQFSGEIHLQWLRQGKPKQLIWRNKTVILNQQGWPESVAANKNGLNCALLWQGLLDTDMLLNNQMVRVKVLGDNLGYDSGCLFYLAEQTGFEYWSKTGQVRLVQVDKTLL
ncbi:hypothetical protein [Motilimonas eburnea]|uniref:hypothetical protein n=1 Tax=Motilimonas eburnea TaxID=1737488 RepID=UPI001E602FA8|nr:hypothetical protein [Motilimonas eburnea]MCE2572128.1 hypothetical protein [Motilimonas eburnea]